MKIVVTGASGFIGKALVPALRADGHSVTTLTRGTPRGAFEQRWDPTAPTGLAPSAVEGAAAIIHLAGAGIADKRWTEEWKKTVLTSRTVPTALLARTLAGLGTKPTVLLSGSAIGWYGDTGDTAVDETAPRGAGFLADVVEQWEAATAPAEAAGIRVCHLRTGIVLGKGGGALAKQLPLAKLGLGGPLGNGRQYQSWIPLADEVGAIRFLLTADQVSGAVNLTGPEPVRQVEVARALGRAVHRPAVVPAPAFALRAALGRFADEGVLASQRVLPRRLLDAGYPFVATDVDAGVASALG